MHARDPLRLERFRSRRGYELSEGGALLSTSADWVEVARRIPLLGRVVVVGLGLGGSVRLALGSAVVSSVLVVEIRPAVVELFRSRWPVSAADPRLRVVVGRFPDCVDVEGLLAWATVAIDYRGALPRVFGGGFAPGSTISPLPGR